MAGANFAKSVLSDHETIRFVQRPHWLAYVPAIFWLLIPILGWYLALKIIIRLISTEIVITNKRLLVKYGLIARRTEELSASKIEEINLNQSIIGRLFGYGHVRIEGSGAGVIHLHMIDSPANFIKELGAIRDRR